MSDIPEDIKKMAKAYATEWYGGLEGNTASFRNMENWFSRVIFAEREACAKIAEEWADRVIAAEIRRR